MVAAPSSRQGKTVVTAALARHYAQQGKRVQVLKLGPDYLDPTILECASGQAVWNLDWWMMGEAHCRQILHHATQHNDVVLIESLMGLHDNEPSSAQLAQALGVPILLVISMAKFAQTAVAVAQGMASYDVGAKFVGVVGNLLGSNHHHTLVAQAFTDAPNAPPYLGSLRRDERLALPERHLGLVQGSELPQLDVQLDAAAQSLLDYEIDLNFPSNARSQFIVTTQDTSSVSGLLAGKTIAIARDAAFSFIYPANVVALEQQGAQLVYFSPLHEKQLPACDAVWLPGGYPELHLEVLGENHAMQSAMSVHIEVGKVLYAECGGMMVLGKYIKDLSGKQHAGLGLFDAEFEMHAHFQSIGYQRLSWQGKELRGHSFHHSSMTTALKPVAHCQKTSSEKGEGFCEQGKLRVTYAHLYFASNPQLMAALFT